MLCRWFPHQCCSPTGGRRHRWWRGYRTRHRPWPRGLRRLGGRSGSETPRPRSRQPQEVGGLGLVTDVRDGDEVDAALARTIGELGTGANPGEQCRRGLPLSHPGDVGERVGRALPGQPQARDAVHPASGSDHGGDGDRREHHQRDLDRRRPCGSRVRGLRGRQGGSHQLHEDRRPGARSVRHPGERTGP